ncbi:hypothetical protein DYB32_004734 [Aphanomyces invadans]|uniref:Kinesin motor domain-containing protein n=1 Tax=Aphanomyces invadans TaxID=157072 RepID=A0A418AWS5_9STRA|nr:hypothetical protein DYB32_004734 [Aphanomyces invadans]
MIHSQQTDFTCTIAFVDIYHDKLYDLLDGRGSDPKTLRENTACHQVYVQNLVEKRVQTAADALAWLDVGCTTRRAASHRDRSRSHTIFTIRLTQTRPSPGGRTKVVTSALHCVDLAGSERPATTLHKPVKDVTQINKSLSSLATVILALGDMTRAKRHVPYRDCKLTFLLREALGGNSKTTVVATAVADDRGITDMLGTLQFVERVKHVTTVVSPNEFLDGGGAPPDQDGSEVESTWPYSAARVHPVAPRSSNGSGHVVASTIAMNEVPAEIVKCDSWTQQSPDKTVGFTRPATRLSWGEHDDAVPTDCSSAANEEEEVVPCEMTQVEMTIASMETCALTTQTNFEPSDEAVAPDIVPVSESALEGLAVMAPTAEAPAKRGLWTKEQSDFRLETSPVDHPLPGCPPCSLVAPLPTSAVELPPSPDTALNCSTLGRAIPVPFVATSGQATQESVVATDTVNESLKVTRPALSIGACLVALQAGEVDIRPPSPPKPNDALPPASPGIAKRDSWTQSDEQLHSQPTKSNEPSGSDPGGRPGVAPFVVGMFLGGCTVYLLVYLRQRR